MRSLLALLLVAALAPCMFAATTGKIAGQVTDAQTGEVLPGVNVLIEGTTMGAATNLEGRYNILNVPPGSYSLRASMIGYSTYTVQNVRVDIELTTRVDMKLTTEVISGQEVTVVATRPVVVQDI
ncbi:carboxypeptidase-like regulatory domain-containing protein, partial [candidate division KSB1 bacterium]|nr:carboxypeptidase-like regulatory domain-containing protein [candidate division KSB1 bacterium]